MIEKQAAMLRVETSSDDDHAEPDLPGIEELGCTGRARRQV
ncbi:hypothetical protein [Nannocystis pusilla]